MKSFRRIVWIVCVLVGFAIPGYSLDRIAFSFTRYQLEVRVDPQGHALAARGKITLHNDSHQPQTTAALQISSTLQWRIMESAGKPLGYVAQPYTTDIDHTGSVNEAIVTFPAAVAPGASVEIEVGYSGSVNADTTRLTRIGTPAPVAAQTDWDQIGENFTAIRGLGYVVWYPVSLDAANLSEGELSPALAAWRQRERGSQFTSRLCWVGDPEQNLTIAANGNLAGVGRQEIQTEEGNATLACSTYDFSNSTVTVPTFAVGQFEKLDRPTITISHLAEHKLAAQDYALATEKLAPFIADWFGAPREKVRVIELNLPGAAAYDSGAVLFTPLFSDREQIELAMAHQLTHAAFNSPRPWMSEGLAQFAQALEREQQAGRDSAVSLMATRLPALVAVEKAVDTGKPAGSAPDSLIATDDDVYYRTKAMYVWWMLREMAGDAALQAAIKAYRPEQDKTPSYFQQLLQAHSKRDWEWFFDDWVYRDRGLPDFRVDTVYARQTLPGNYVVTVTVENLGTAGAQVPVIVRTASGDLSQPLVVRAKEKMVTRIRVGLSPSEVVVNDDSVPESDTTNNTFKVPPASQ